jgi:hypothetical protein
MDLQLRHDVAFATALALLDVLRLRPEDRRKVFNEFYRTCRASLDAYEAQKTQPNREPSNN